MPTPRANAKFLIQLAAKGKPFAPHIPKRDSDKGGLFWALFAEVWRQEKEGSFPPLAKARLTLLCIRLRSPSLGTNAFNSCWGQKTSKGISAMI